jgi:hypothetical protein
MTSLLTSWGAKDLWTVAATDSRIGRIVFLHFWRHDEPIKIRLAEAAEVCRGDARA